MTPHNDKIIHNICKRAPFLLRQSNKKLPLTCIFLLPFFLTIRRMFNKCPFFCVNITMMMRNNDNANECSLLISFFHFPFRQKKRFSPAICIHFSFSLPKKTFFLHHILALPLPKLPACFRIINKKPLQSNTFYKCLRNLARPSRRRAK